MGARAGYWWALGMAVVLYVFSRTDKGQAVVNSATDSVLSTIRGIRNNNPGNLRDNAFLGASPNNTGGYEVYDTMQNGVRAAARQLKLYVQRGINTPRKIVSTWAPDSENNTAAYIAAFVDSTGIPADGLVNLSDKTTSGHWFKALRAIFRHECGAPAAAMFVSDAMVLQGIATA